MNKLETLLEKVNYNFVNCLVCNKKPEIIVSNIKDIDDIEAQVKCKCGIQLTYTYSNVIEAVADWNKIMKQKNPEQFLLEYSSNVIEAIAGWNKTTKQKNSEQLLLELTGRIVYIKKIIEQKQYNEIIDCIRKIILETNKD